jgi:hypothetical protein
MTALLRSVGGWLIDTLAWETSFSHPLLQPIHIRNPVREVFKPLSHVLITPSMGRMAIVLFYFYKSNTIHLNSRDTTFSKPDVAGLGE